MSVDILNQSLSFSGFTEVITNFERRSDDGPDITNPPVSGLQPLGRLY